MMKAKTGWSSWEPCLAFRGIIMIMSHKTERQRRNRNQRIREKAKKLAKAVTTVNGQPLQAGKVTDWHYVTTVLNGIALGLNTLEECGVTVQLAHGAVITDAGYVLSIGDGNQNSKWQVRTRQLTEFEPVNDEDG